MISTVLLSTDLQAAQPIALDCSFSPEGQLPGEEPGARPLSFAIEVRGSNVASVRVSDPTGVFSSGRVAGFISSNRRGSRYAEVPADQDPRWRGRIEPRRITLTGIRRQVTLVADAQRPGFWTGRLRYDLGGPVVGMFLKQGPLTCQPTGAAAEGISK